MKKINNIIGVLIIFCLLGNCSTLKKGFTNDKKKEQMNSLLKKNSL